MIPEDFIIFKSSGIIIFINQISYKSPFIGYSDFCFFMIAHFCMDIPD